MKPNSFDTAWFDSMSIEQAYQWLCLQRKHFPPNSDVWYLRFYWTAERGRSLTELTGNLFYFQPQQRVVKANGEVVHLWSSIDSLVLKMMAIYLSNILPSSALCTHLKGHGGAKQTVNSIYQANKTHKFVFRTDVKSYYDSIDHSILQNKLAKYVKDKHLLNLLTQYLKRSVEVGGNFIDIPKGISSGCPLSPLIASFYLCDLDKAMEHKQVYYRRYMGDIIVLANCVWRSKEQYFV